MEPSYALELIQNRLFYIHTNARPDKDTHKMPSTQVKSIRDLAFNVALVAYDYNYSNRVPKQLLIFRGFGVLSTVDRGADLLRHHVPAITPSPAELKITPDLLCGLWVGMRPSTTIDPKLARSRKAESVDDQSGFADIPYDSRSLRVILLPGMRSNGYHCLADEKDGLCLAYKIPKDDVFFFSEYRDDALKDKDRRRVSWSRKAGSICKSLKRVVYLNLDTNRDVEDESESEQESVIAVPEADKEMPLAVVRQTVRIRPVEYTMLHRLASGTQVLSIEECKVAIQQFYLFAPDLKNKTFEASEFQQISRGLVDADLFLKESYLRPVVVSFRKSGSNNIRGAYDFVREALGPQNEHKTAYTESNLVFLRTELSKIRHQVDAMIDFITTARARDDEASAQALVPEFARKEAIIRLLVAQQDQSASQPGSDDENSWVISSEGAERPLKRVRSDT